MTGRVLPLDHRYAHRRKTRLWYFNGERFIYEDKELIFSANTQATLADLVASWLSLLDEEQLLTKKVAVQSVMLDPQKTTAFISFDQNPFEKWFSTHAKLMFLQGLLKTLKESTIPLKKVQFLVQHAPLKDHHLDCVHPWTIEGYAP